VEYHRGGAAATHRPRRQPRSHCHHRAPWRIGHGTVASALVQGAFHSRRTISAYVATSASASFGEGRFIVGTDIAPGTYRTTGKAGHFDCYWERLKDTSGTSESMIANNLAPGPATVTIDKTDGAFQTRWCRPWIRVN
jgi:hypothetical protein